MAATKEYKSNHKKQDDRHRALVLLIKKQEMSGLTQVIATPSKRLPIATPCAPVKKKRYEPLRHLIKNRQVPKPVFQPIVKKKKTVRWASPVKQESFEDSMFAAAIKAKKEEVIIKKEEIEESCLDFPEFIEPVAQSKIITIKAKPEAGFVEEAVESSHSFHEIIEPVAQSKIIIPEAKPQVGCVEKAVGSSHTELEIEQIIVDAMCKSLCGLLQGLHAVERRKVLLDIQETHAAESKASHHSGTRITYITKN